MARRRFQHLPALVAAALLTFVASSSRADDDPRRKEADVIYNEGLRLHDQHKEAEALEKFQKAFGVYPSPNILFNVARQEQLLDKSLLALRHYREAMKSALLHPTNATLGKQYIAELEARLGRVELGGARWAEGQRGQRAGDHVAGDRADRCGTGDGCSNGQARRGPATTGPSSRKRVA